MADFVNSNGVTRESVREAFNRDGLLQLLQEIEARGDLSKASAFNLTFYFAVGLALEGESNAEKLLGVVRQTKAEGNIGHNYLIEVLWLYGVELERGDNAEAKRGYCALVRSIFERELVDVQKLAERLEESLLGEVGVVSMEVYKKRKARINTRLLYEQTKFQLFREESEGYSRLLSELLRNEVTVENFPIVLENVLGIVGMFDLDPNRVVDVILTAFECFFNNEVFPTLLRQFNVKNIVHLLGFRFVSYANGKETETPKSLYRVAAALVKLRFFELEELWTYLSPVDEEISRFKTRMWNALLTQRVVKKAFTKLEHKLEPAAAEELKAMNLEIAAPISREFFNFFQQKNNQKLGLIEALLSVNAWRAFETVYEVLATSVDLATCRPLRDTLLRFLEWFIEPVYRGLSPTRYYATLPKKITRLKGFPVTPGGDSTGEMAPPHETNGDFLKRLDRIMRFLGAHVGASEVIYTKLIRVLRRCLSSAKEAEDEAAIAVIRKVTVECLMPGLGLMKCNPGAAAEVWSIFGEFEFTVRFDAYTRVIDDGILFREAAVVARLSEDFEEANDVFKRLTNNKVEKKEARMCSKKLHNNPFFIALKILRNIQSYDNLIKPSVNALLFTSSLTLDLIVYMILKTLSDDSRNKIKDGSNFEAWFNNLNAFSGEFFKKFFVTRLDLVAVLVYICNKLAEKDHADVLLLREIIMKMTGFEIIDSMNQEQVKALAGGPILQRESSAIDEELKKGTQKARAALESVFWERTLGMFDLDGEKASLAFVLLTRLSQERASFLFEAPRTSPKLIAMIYDKINEILIQLTHFLRFPSTATRPYSTLLPREALAKLLIVYKVQPELAFHIIRPGYKSIAKMTDADFKEAVDEVRSVMTSMRPEDLFLFGTRSIGYPQLVESYGNIFKDISPEMYTLFWLLTLENLHISTESYDKGVEELNKKISEHKRKEGGTSRKAIDKEVEKLRKVIDNLKGERVIYVEAAANVEKFVKEREELLFGSITLDANGASTLSSSFIQLCLLPRIRLSKSDAFFAAKFVELTIKARGNTYFNYLANAIQLVKTVLPFTNICTEKEAVNVGIFFVYLLRHTVQWENETKLRLEVRKTFTSMESESFVKYQHVILAGVLNNMHKFFRVTLAEPSRYEANYIALSNTIWLLNTINDIYPAIKDHAEALIGDLKKMQAEIPDNVDLNMQAKSLEIKINSRMKDLSDIKLQKLKEDRSKNLVTKVSDTTEREGKETKEKEKEKEKEVDREKEKEKDRGDQRRGNDDKDKADKRVKESGEIEVPPGEARELKRRKVGNSADDQKDHDSLIEHQKEKILKERQKDSKDGKDGKEGKEPRERDTREPRDQREGRSWKDDDRGRQNSRRSK